MGYLGKGIAGPLATYIEDSFTGDGSTVAFTLSEQLSADAGALVFLNGALQDTGEYSISGLTCTFGSAPADGVLIRVRYARREVNMFLPDNSVGVDQLTGMGPVVQMVYTQDGDTEADISDAITVDDSIPQVSEMTAFAALNTTITPKNSSNILEIEVQVNFDLSATAIVYMGLFKDSDADALTIVNTEPFSSSHAQLRLSWRQAAGSTSAQTFKIYMGCNSTQTIYVNQTNNASSMGGVFNTYMKITEYSVAL